MSSNTSELVQTIVQFYAENDCNAILELIEDISTNPSATEEEKLALRTLSWPLPRLMDLQILSRFITSRSVGHIYSIGCGTGLLEYLLLDSIIKNSSEGIPDKEEKLHQEDNDQQQFYIPVVPQQPQPPQAIIPQITGIEIDSKWWNSSYSPPNFINLLYINETFPIDQHFGQLNDIIIFSYFNCMKIFVDYLTKFHGSYVIIIGPSRIVSNNNNKKQYCAPSPLDLRDGDSDYDDKAAEDVDHKSSSEDRNSNSNGITAKCKIPTKEWNIVLYQRFGFEEVDNVAIYARI